MGKLIYKNETTFCHIDDPEEINLKNWRVAKEVKDYRIYDGSTPPGLLIVLESFRCYFIPNFTFDILNNENNFDNELDIPYEFVRNCLSCFRCHGSGKIDWVDNVMGMRNKKYIGYEYKLPKFNLSTHIKVDTYHMGVPHLNVGDDICKYCNGCGIHKKSLLAIFS